MRFLILFPIIEAAPLPDPQPNSQLPFLVTRDIYVDMV